MTSVSVDNLSLALVFGLVLVALAISQKEKLDLTKDILWAVARTVVQLFLVGYVLHFIFLPFVNQFFKNRAIYLAE